jgi:hypothetical protein
MGSSSLLYIEGATHNVDVVSLDMIATMASKKPAPDLIRVGTGFRSRSSLKAAL